VRFALEGIFDPSMSAARKVSVMEMAREALAKATENENFLSPSKCACMYRFHRFLGVGGVISMAPKSRDPPGAGGGGLPSHRPHAYACLIPPSCTLPPIPSYPIP
jgi:hypothetical protein